MTRPIVCPICVLFIKDDDLKYTAHKEGLIHAQCYRGECYAAQEQFDHDIRAVETRIHQSYGRDGGSYVSPQQAFQALARIAKHRPHK